MFTTAKTPRPFNCCCSCCDSFFAVDLEVGWVEKKGWVVEVVDAAAVVFVATVVVVADIMNAIAIVVVIDFHFVVAAAGNVV